jgi:hypothetical protein
LGNGLALALDHSTPARLRIPGIMSRTRLAERITLTPEGIDHQAHRRLVHSMLAQGHVVFNFSYHSSSLAPGNTPYVRNEDDLKEMLKRIDQFLDFFFNEVGGTAMTPMQLYKTLAQQEQDSVDKLKASA